MQYIIDTGTSVVTRRQITDIPFNKVKPRSLFIGNQRLYFIQVSLKTGRKIIQPNYIIIAFQQAFDEVGANKTGSAGDKEFHNLIRVIIHFLCSLIRGHCLKLLAASGQMVIAATRFHLTSLQ